MLYKISIKNANIWNNKKRNSTDLSSVSEITWKQFVKCLIISLKAIIFHPECYLKVSICDLITDIALLLFALKKKKILKSILILKNSNNYNSGLVLKWIVKHSKDFTNF